MRLPSFPHMRYVGDWQAGLSEASRLAVLPSSNPTGRSSAV
ncbi:hypothetical protein HMPREF9141_0512 [Prevotella multiformis DSM 16608]|uniref:Uncharacterized protein n=1 Tax=Prevotella multiformis DSM 16608 TaxID=888743 RepID=F0F4J6_9BACT|nr:hypothetical protein HMPREF9141_0512 [Prevotella multiformis DSM 16608]